MGTADGPRERLGPEIDTPGLRGLARSAPYLHDGSAATLLDVLTTANPADEHGVTSHLDPSQLQVLVAYMLAWPAARDGCLDCPAPTGLPPAAQPLTQPAATTALATATRGRARRAGGPLSISGHVTDASSGAPVGGALVTIRATGISTKSKADGSFVLPASASSESVEVTAWAPGTYIAYVATAIPAAGLELALRAYHTTDDPTYEWVDPTPEGGSASACGNCHPVPLQQWQGNAHGGAVGNPRFFSFYNGTNVTGTETVTPGYLLDFPGTTGICAACHAPGAAIDAPYATDMNAVRGEVTAGVHCDFCHKIGGAYLHARAPVDARCETCHDADGGLVAPALEVYRNAPGVQSYRVLRPPPGEQIFIGPYPDIHDPDTFLPFISESAFCAPCHEFSFWGTPIYTSYSEWLASPWSDRESGQHLPVLPHAPDRRHPLRPAREGRPPAPAGDDPVPPPARRAQPGVDAGDRRPRPRRRPRRRRAARLGGGHQQRRRTPRPHGPPRPPPAAPRRSEGRRRDAAGAACRRHRPRVGRHLRRRRRQGLRQAAARRRQRRVSGGELLEAGRHRRGHAHRRPGDRRLQLLVRRPRRILDRQGTGDLPAVCSSPSPTATVGPWTSW